MVKETLEQTSWRAMKSRCYNPKAKGYHNYGGRGITVCDRWKHSFLNFLADMGPSPGNGYTIERSNTNGNYEPSNCCWATRAKQNLNKRTNRLISIGGITKPLMTWCRERNINYTTARWRLDKLKLDPEAALSQNLVLPPHVQGSAHPTAKITENDVRLILIDHASGTTISTIAKHYNLDRKTVRQIIKRITWKHVV